MYQCKGQVSNAGAGTHFTCFTSTTVQILTRLHAQSIRLFRLVGPLAHSLEAPVVLLALLPRKAVNARTQAQTQFGKYTQIETF